MLPVLRGRAGRPAFGGWREFDRLFDRVFNDVADFGGTRVWDFGVTDDEQGVRVRAELPGFYEKELDVQVHGGVLTIEAEHKVDGREGHSYRSYRRSVVLPEGLDVEKAQATYRNGVLELHLPRHEAAQPKRIPVTAHAEAATATEQPATYEEKKAE